MLYNVLLHFNGCVEALSCRFLMSYCILGGKNSNYSPENNKNHIAVARSLLIHKVGGWHC